MLRAIGANVIEGELAVAQADHAFTDALHPIATEHADILVDLLTRLLTARARTAQPTVGASTPAGARPMSAAAEEIAIALHSGETLPALVAEADTEHPAGSIVVVGDIGGARREFTDMIAGELAAAGYDAIVPEFFFRQGPRQSARTTRS